MAVSVTQQWPVFSQMSFIVESVQRHNIHQPKLLKHEVEIWVLLSKTLLTRWKVKVYFQILA